jgi:hypothetical protein
MNAVLFIQKLKRLKEMDHKIKQWISSYMDWIDLALNKGQWRAVVNTVVNLQVSYNVGKFLSGWATDDFSRRVQLHGGGHSHLHYMIVKLGCSSQCQWADIDMKY